MLGDILRHWRYFIPRFLGYGTVLGGLFGGLTYPILGVFVGAPWGFFGGLILGILMGIGVPVYNRYFAPDDADSYQNHLAFGAGMLATVVMALPLLFIYALVAGIVTAYIGHQYAENPPGTDEKRKNSMDAYQKRERVFTHVANAMMSKANYVTGLAIVTAMIGYTVWSILDPAVFFEWIVLLIIPVAGAIYGYVVSAMIAAVNALFIVFANRLFFTSDTPKSVYKGRLVPLVGILTLFLSMIVAGGIGAPFAAIAGAFGASKYADWYYEQDTEEKAKRSAENLIDKQHDDDSDYLPEDSTSIRISTSIR